MKNVRSLARAIALVATFLHAGIALAATAELEDHLRALCDKAGGTIGVAVTQIETGETVTVAGAERLPLYSVFKLPLAIAVLEDVAEGKLSLDRKVHFEPQDARSGAKENPALWSEPVDRSIRELLELSIVQSDNTSADALLELVGGPETLTRRLAAAGFPEIEIRSSVRGFKSFRRHPNTASAEALAKLLTRLQKGEVMKGPQREMLLDLMSRATTGQRRLRGALPPGTPVADKTGTGEPEATNDVGIITLPGKAGHLAIAVLVSRSTLPFDEQERLIAGLARAAYDHYARLEPPARRSEDARSGAR